MIKDLYLDAKNIKQKDPAARNIWEVIILYQGFHILIFYVGITLVKLHM